MAFTYITLTGTWKNAAGAPCSGQVTAVPSEDFLNGGVVISVDPVSAPLIDGILDLKLIATNDPGTSTTSGKTLTYTIYVQILGQPLQTLITSLPNTLVGSTIAVYQLPV